MLEIFRCGWAVSFAGWRRTERTSEDRKAQQTAGYPLAGHGRLRHAADRAKKKLGKNSVAIFS